MLIYGSDRDNRPCTVLPIHGYMARAAPNAIPRDQRRSESTFEIFRPGSRTFQVENKMNQQQMKGPLERYRIRGNERTFDVSISVCRENSKKYGRMDSENLRVRRC